MGSPHAPLAERYHRLLDQRGPDECWPFRGVDAHGYGQISNKPGPPLKAHRLALTLAGVTIPPNTVVDHTCHTADLSCPGGSTCPHRRCCNPAHLAVTTNRKNVMAGRSGPAVNARKTACKRGHPLDEVNTYVDPRGYRHCRECSRQHESRRVRHRSRKDRS